MSRSASVNVGCAPDHHLTWGNFAPGHCFSSIIGRSEQMDLRMSSEGGRGCKSTKLRIWGIVGPKKSRTNGYVDLERARTLPPVKSKSKGTVFRIGSPA